MSAAGLRPGGPDTESRSPGTDRRMLAFGPVPSRRFGRSLGVNNIPPKRCSYSCIYCQLGPTASIRIRRRPFVRVEDLVRAVEERVAACSAGEGAVDYITVVPDGEPTLDVWLGPEIRALKKLGIRIAVITNGSLLWRPKVRSALAEADVVSVKVDATERLPWRRINRPGRQLRLPTILEGLETFARSFSGEVWTETMLVRGVNDDVQELERLAMFLERVEPVRAYVALPTRPPAVSDVRAPPARSIVEALELFESHLPAVHLLAGKEHGMFGHGSDPAEDLLGILAVHPMPEGAAREYLEDVEADPAILDELLASERAARVVYRGDTFLVGRWRGAPPR